MKRLKKIKADPYIVDVWFTDDAELFQRKRTALTGRPRFEGDFSGMVSATDSRGAMVIGVFDGADRTLVHETAHATTYVFSHIAMPINEDTTEAFAYLQESLYAQCAAAIEKWLAKE